MLAFVLPAVGERRLESVTVDGPPPRPRNKLPWRRANAIEEGKAPDILMAEKRYSSGKVIRTRPLFPFPKVAKYKGTGSPDDAANFVSQTVDR